MFRKILNSLAYRFPMISTPLLKGKGFFILLHRVLNEEERNKYEWNKGLSISPEALTKWMNFFQIKGYDFISVDEAYKRVTQQSTNTKKFVCFTLDDGYKDNLTQALPVFKNYNVPFTIYIANCYPEKTTIHWWYFLEDYVKSQSSIDLEPLGINFCSSITDENRELVYRNVRALLRKSTYDIQLRFAKEICCIDNLNDINEKLNLSWGDIKTLSNERLVTIGAHTINHVSLSHQTLADSRTEIVLGVKELEDKIGQEVNHFAYPYGSMDDVNKELFPYLKEAKIKLAVLNHPGSIFNRSEDHILDIPRMGLTDETPLEKVEDLISGKIHLKFNGIKKKLL